ncbi:MAG: hypothetical protein HY820_33770 [Acidobacteria bacterium]|nr:hypothetical protein [Acidobacteriota bacterium]
MDEKDFYVESRTSKSLELICSFCRSKEQYDLAWVVRKKKGSLPPRADERDRAKFAKAQSYMVLAQDKVACKNPRCRRTFEISGHKTIAFL